MAYYDTYRSAPGWGTSSYQFITPLQPQYQPQSNWRGLDYYRAHGGFNDPSTYDYVWNRVRTQSNFGVGIDEARIWHRRAYGGMGDIQRMMPADVGAAAAYEVWRNWKYHYGIYGQPLGGDRERQREALVGLAVGEASRLWQYTGHPDVPDARMEACEAAAGTATRILNQSWVLDNDMAYDDMAYDDMYMGRGRLTRRNSVASMHSLHARSHSRPSSPYYGTDTYGSAYGSSYIDPYTSTGSVYGDSYVDPYVDPINRHRSYSSSIPIAGATSPYTTGYTPSAYAGTASYSPYTGYATSGGYAASYPTVQPQISPVYGTTPSVTVLSPASTSSHHSHGHHKHRHRSSSRHKHRHSRRNSFSGSYYTPSVTYGY